MCQVEFNSKEHEIPTTFMTYVYAVHLYVRADTLHVEWRNSAMMSVLYDRFNVMFVSFRFRRVRR